MTLRKRYTLLGIGIILFFIVAPAAVLGIQGYFYDWENKKIIKTGILVAKTEPKSAQVSLTGPKEVKRDSSGTIRFLPPGDYLVKVEKDGFFPWEKRFTIRGGLVTWIEEKTDKKYLLPKNLTSRETLASYRPNDDSRVSNFTYELVRQSPTSTEMMLVSRPVNAPDNSTILAVGIPYSQSARAVPAPNGLVFLHLNRSLYQVNSYLEYLADGVDFALWDNSLNKLVYGNSHEINLFNPYEAGPAQRELITRTSEPGGSFCSVSEMGYMLRSYGTYIKAIELDGRDRRNIYEIISSQSPLEIIECSRDGERLVVKNGDKFEIFRLKP